MHRGVISLSRQALVDNPSSPHGYQYPCKAVIEPSDELRELTT